MPEDKPEDKKVNPYFALFITLICLALGVVALALTKHYAKIDGDAIFIALLLIPIFVYLTITGKLDEISIGGVSAKFFKDSVEAIKKHVKDNVTEVGENVTEVGEYEPERSKYLGKLKQILQDKSTFYLMYADVDGLRQHTRKLFLDEKDNSTPLKERRSENDFRKTIIRELEFALTDAFCETEKNAKKKNKVAKYDIFHLEQPDVVMIVRQANIDQQAYSVAKQAQEIFKKPTENPDPKDRDFKGHTATIAIVSRDEMKDAKPRGLDKIAIRKLTEGKEQGKKQGKKGMIIRDRLSS